MGAHDHRTVADALLQRALRPAGDVLDGEGVLDVADPLHGAMREALGLAGAAVDGAGLVEMDMRFDEARRDQPPAAINHLPRLARQAGAERDDAATLHADIDRAAI